MANAPFKDIESLNIQLYNYDGNAFDLTHITTAFTIHENIYYPFIYGEIAFIDNAGLLERVPMLGQEHLTIVMELNQVAEPLTLAFFIGGIEQVKPTGTGHSSVKLSLLGFEQVNDTYFTFSRLIKSAVSTDIICNLYEEFFERKVNVDPNSVGAVSPQLVVPYTTPLKVIKSLLKNTWAADKTPLFLYDSAYRKEVSLTSYGAMFKLPPTFDVTPIVSANLDGIRGHRGGFVTKYLHERRGTLESYTIPEAYNTFRIAANGGYRHLVQHADYSTKKIDILDFDYRTSVEGDANLIMGDYLSDKLYAAMPPGQPDSRTSTSDNNLQNTDKSFGQRATHSMVARRYTNKYAFSRGEGDTDNSVRNLYNVDNQLERSAFEQHAQRHRTVMVTAQGSYHPAIEVGRTVELNMRLHLPAVPKDASNANNLIDVLNSGDYAVAGMEHRYERDGETNYRVNYQLIRDGVNAYA